MWSSSLFQEMTVAPESVEPFAALPFVPLTFADERTNAVTREPSARKMAMEVARTTIHFFFLISVFSFRLTRYLETESSNSVLFHQATLTWSSKNLLLSHSTGILIS